jgi:hypothetical protein
MSPSASCTNMCSSWLRSHPPDSTIATPLTLPRYSCKSLRPESVASTAMSRNPLSNSCPKPIHPLMAGACGPRSMHPAPNRDETQHSRPTACGRHTQAHPADRRTLLRRRRHEAGIPGKRRTSEPRHPPIPPYVAELKAHLPPGHQSPTGTTGKRKSADALAVRCSAGIHLMASLATGRTCRQ